MLFLSNNLAILEYLNLLNSTLNGLNSQTIIRNYPFNGNELQSSCSMLRAFLKELISQYEIRVK